MRAAFVTVLAVFAVTACAQPRPSGIDSAKGVADGPMAAEIRRTAYGVPHVKADNFAGIGFGAGYALAEDNICEIADRIITTRGERSKFFGPGEGGANVASDLFHKRLIAGGELERLLNGPKGSIDTPSEDARAFARGYAAGVSRYLRETGAAKITDPRCKDAPWVQDLTEIDYWRQTYAGEILIQVAAVAAAAPPGAPGDAAALPNEPLLDPLIETRRLGSNALGLGREVTKTGYGVLFGNPHYPWAGPNRFYRIHFTIPNKLNVVGVSMIADPLLGIGHNEHMAWSHTVSTARRFGIFELKLDPADATRYIYDGVSTPMTQSVVSIDVKDAPPITHTFYSTRFGPILESTDFPWDRERAFAIRYVPNGVRVLDQYIEIWQVKSVRELRDSMARFQAAGFNTTAADASGETFFGDMGLVPNVTPELVQACAISERAKSRWQEQRIPVLDGSRHECDWLTDPDSTAPGVVGSSKTPQLLRTDYVSQMNDSHWLTNADHPLEGYSRVFGEEKTARSLRTRQGLDIIEKRRAGKDGLGPAGFDLASMQAAFLQNRNLGGEMVRDDLVALCRASKVQEVKPACEVLANWDLKVKVDSRGAHLFRLFVTNGGLVFKVPFDPAQPTRTPNTLDASNPAVLGALEKAVRDLNELGIPLDARWGDVHNETVGGERIPMPGGSGREGIFNVVGATSLTPKLGWTDISSGASWIMTVEFTANGPRSEGVLTYSQSANPESPWHSDQTRLYSVGGWDDLLFSPAAVEAKTASMKTITE